MLVFVFVFLLSDREDSNLEDSYLEDLNLEDSNFEDSNMDDSNWEALTPEPRNHSIRISRNESETYNVNESAVVDDSVQRSQSINITIEGIRG